MVRQLHQILGYYVPAFFEMHVDTNNDDMTINKLTPFEMTVLFHEYIHFLQDISTYYGLNRIYVYSEYLHSVVNRIYNNTANVIHVPVTITDNNDNVILNQQIQRFTSGDDGGEDGISCFTISDIQEGFDTLVTNPHMPSVQNIIVTTIEGDGFIFGSIAISESMAYLMEQCCSPSFFKKSPEFPYMSAEKVADYYVPHFSDDKLMVLAICDMALMNSNPGVYFVEIMKDIRDGRLYFNSPEEIYDHFYQIPMTIMGQKVSLLQVFHQLLIVVKRQLKSYLRNMPMITSSYYEWINRIFDFAWDWRRNDKYFLLKMAKHQDLATNSYFGFCVNKVGTPLMSNNNGNYYKIPPNGMNNDTNVEYFKAFSQIEQLFSKGVKPCSLYKWCCESPNSTPSELCNSTPWRKVNDRNRCPYALLWYHWKLSKYEVV